MSRVSMLVCVHYLVVLMNVCTIKIGFLIHDIECELLPCHFPVIIGHHQHPSMWGIVYLRIPSGGV